MKSTVLLVDERKRKPEKLSFSQMKSAHVLFRPMTMPLFALVSPRRAQKAADQGVPVAKEMTLESETYELSAPSSDSAPVPTATCDGAAVITAPPLAAPLFLAGLLSEKLPSNA